jgi:hypothetical protein
MTARSKRADQVADEQRERRVERYICAQLAAEARRRQTPENQPPRPPRPRTRSRGPAARPGRHRTAQTLRGPPFGYARGFKGGSAGLVAASRHSPALALDFSSSSMATPGPVGVAQPSVAAEPTQVPYLYLKLCAQEFVLRGRARQCLYRGPCTQARPQSGPVCACPAGAAPCRRCVPAGRGSCGPCGPCFRAGDVTRRLTRRLDGGR